MDRWPNLISMFFAQAEKLADQPFLWAKENGSYVSQSWADVADKVLAISKGLSALGIEGIEWCSVRRIDRNGQLRTLLSWPQVASRYRSTRPIQ